MAGFASGKQVEAKRDHSIRQFLKTDPRFRDFTPAEVAMAYRQKDLTQSRLDWIHVPVAHEQLFDQVDELTVRRFYGEEEADGFEVTNGFWCVRIASYRRLYQGKVARTLDWEIQIKTGRAWMVFPAVIRERVIRHLGEGTYEQWKAEVVSTEGKLREALQVACTEIKEPMAASWVTSPSSGRLLQRMGVAVKGEWGFLFKGQSFMEL